MLHSIQLPTRKELAARPISHSRQVRKHAPPGVQYLFNAWFEVNQHQLPDGSINPMLNEVMQSLSMKLGLDWTKKASLLEQLLHMAEEYVQLKGRRNHEMSMF